MKKKKRLPASPKTAAETPDERRRRLKYERTKRDRAAHPERYAAYARKYRKRYGNTEEYRRRKAEQDKAYREKKGEEYLDKARAYYRKNREAVLAQTKAYR